MRQQCPGQDGRRWSPDDVSEKECPGCGYPIEFFKFDLMRPCPDCGRRTVNPRFNLECAEWCERAANCIGEGSTLYKEVQTLRSRVEEKIQDLFASRQAVLEHIDNVTDLADQIGREEQFSPLSVILSGLLHELGDDSLDLEKLNLKAMDEYEIESIGSGADIAEILLQELDIPDHYRQEVMRNISALAAGEVRKASSFQILKDAHRLASLRENSPEKLGELDLSTLNTEGAIRVASVIRDEVQARD